MRVDGLPVISADSELILGSRRLELRPIRREDAQKLFPVLSDPALYEYTGDTPPASVDVLAALYASRETRRSPDGDELWLNWLIQLRESAAVIGYMQASVGTSAADLAWVVAVPWQGAGFATEAAQAVINWLRRLGVARLQARINPRHTASQKVAIRSGFQRTSELAEAEEVWILDLVPPQDTVISR